LIEQAVAGRQVVADTAARRPDHLLPIHPYFRDPRPENDVTLSELDDLYLRRLEAASAGGG